MSAADYRTVKQAASDEMIERKSRFIGYCKPVKTQDEAIDFINEIRAMHREATHNVYAYVLREDNIMRYSDDGEPAGTAGMPVLEIIKKEGLTDICVVVTRYFGGVLLGAGGLVRAYAKSAKIGVQAAVPVDMIYCDVYKLRCDYGLYGKVEYAVNNGGYLLCATEFEDEVVMEIGVQDTRQREFKKTIDDLSCGSAKYEVSGGRYVMKEI